MSIFTKSISKKLNSFRERCSLKTEERERERERERGRERKRERERER